MTELTSKQAAEFVDWLRADPHGRSLTVRWAEGPGEALHFQLQDKNRRMAMRVSYLLVGLARFPEIEVMGALHEMVRRHKYSPHIEERKEDS